MQSFPKARIIVNVDSKNKQRGLKNTPTIFFCALIIEERDFTQNVTFKYYFIKSGADF